MLYGKLKCGLAATSGIHTTEDVLKMLMVGADVTMLCAGLFNNGIEHITTLEKGIRKWMETHEYESVSQLKGSMSYKSVNEPSAFARANYMKVVKSYM